MAVLARSSITLVTSVDIDSVYWFYLLQASTAAAPAKPTTVPATKGNAPSGWTTAEPTTVDINKTLYRVELTYFTDGTGVYSSVNKVSSYEAAKVAYNKATDAQTTANNAATSASTAQSTANSASTAASNAQSTANSASTAAATAQATADAKKSMIKINTASRTFTTAQWKTYGAVGHSENWSTGSSYSNPNIKVGDTAYLIGTVSDGAKGTATIIGTVTAVNGTNGTSSITMTSQQLIFGGDSVDNVNTTANTAKNTADEAKTAATTATNTANSAKTAADNALINTKYNGPVNIGAAVTANRLIMNATTAANTAASYKMVAKNTAYNIESPILYSKTALSTGSKALADHTCYTIGDVTVTGQGGASSLTVNKPVFLKGTLSGTTFTTVNDATFLTQTQPTSSDGYHYIFLGTATSTTNVMLQAEHPLYMFIGGSFHRLGSSSDKILQKWVGSATAAVADAKLNGSYIQANTVTAEQIYVEDLNALGATIGGFEIDSNSIHTAGSSSTSTDSGDIWFSNTTFSREINGTNRSYLNFAIGEHFAVDEDGWLYASHAIISGTITATAGEIGGFAIDSTSIHTKNVAVTSNASNSVALSSSTFTRTIGGTSRSSLKFAIGSNFGVSNTGTLYANSANLNSANLTGSITAAALTTTDTLKDLAVNESAFSIYRWDHFVHMSASISFDAFDIYMQSWGQASNDWRIRDGYRPPKNIWAPVVWGVNGGFKLAAMEIRSDGWINLYGYETYGGAARNLKTAYRAGSGQYGVNGNNTLFFNMMWFTNQTAT